jgi:carboxypeptidase Taq
MSIDDTYDKLIERLREMYELSSAASILSWDQRVNMPPGGAKLRSRQQSRLEELVHRRKTDPELRELINKLHDHREDLSFDRRVVVRETKKEVDRAHKLPSEFVAEKSRVTSEAYNVWTEAKRNNDLESFLPYLEKNVSLAREEADYIGYEDSPYDPLLDQYDPGMTESRIATLFDELRSKLVPVVDRIKASDVRPPTEEKVTGQSWSTDRQEDVGEAFVRQIGYDMDEGRIDTTEHPFCSGYVGDVRITTRYNNSNPFVSLTSLLHEAGHALYEQGLDPDTWGTPLSEPVGMGVHESQSRLWENMVGRSDAFWAWAWPKFQEAFPDKTTDMTRDELLFILHDSQPGFIRVEADEVTYNLHVILRFELERELLHNELEPEQLPDAWNAKMDELLGIEPPDHRQGVLQDVHWSSGAFGYFPSYAIGNLLAAQVFQAAEEDVGPFDDAFSSGNFEPLLSWLRGEIHQRGKRYRTDELTEEVTGSPLQVDPFIEHVKSSYLPYYE